MNCCRELIPTQQRFYTDRNPSACLVRRRTSSCSSIPNNPILEGRSPLVLPSLGINNGLQTCDAREFESWKGSGDLGLEKCTTLIRMSILAILQWSNLKTRLGVGKGVLLLDRVHR